MSNLLFTTKSFNVMKKYKILKPNCTTTRFNNLNCLINILCKNHINYCLAEGTLLGCIRNKELISYDADEDIMVFEYDKSKFNLNLKAQLIDNGFEIIRTNKNCVSVYKNHSYIDIELIRFAGDICYYKKPEYCKYDIGFFTHFKKGVLYNEQFNIPNYSEKLIEKVYGMNWRIPNKKKHNYGVDATGILYHLSGHKSLVSL